MQTRILGLAVHILIALSRRSLSFSSVQYKIAVDEMRETRFPCHRPHTLVKTTLQCRYILIYLVQLQHPVVPFAPTYVETLPTAERRDTKEVESRTGVVVMVVGTGTGTGIGIITIVIAPRNPDAYYYKKPWMRYEQYNDYKYRGYENIPNLNGMKMGIVLGIGIIKGWRVGYGG